MYLGSLGPHFITRAVLENHPWCWHLQNVGIFSITGLHFIQKLYWALFIVPSFSHSFCLTLLILGFSSQWGWTFFDVLSWPLTVPNPSIFQEPFMPSKTITTLVTLTLSSLAAGIAYSFGYLWNIASVHWLSGTTFQKISPQWYWFLLKLS